MDDILYLLLIIMGALLMLAIFMFTIYLQQKDKAYLHYSLYLFVMAGFNIIRILDARLTNLYPLSIHTVETLDPVFSNLGFLMYINFLGVVLNITKGDTLFFKSWRYNRIFVLVILIIFTVLKMTGRFDALAEVIMACCSFLCMIYGLLLLIRVFRFIKEPFYLLIVTGTTIVASSIIAGLIVNYFIYKNRISFPGLAIMETGMMIETILLSTAMGYRLKMVYREKEIYQRSLLEETKRSEGLATQAAVLLRKELDIRNWQNKVSRDLHDDIGATLSSIHVYSSVASKAIDQDAIKAKDALKHINENARRVMDTMSDIVWAMKTSETDENPLEGKLKNYGYELLTPLGINCTYIIDPIAEKKITDMETRKNILLIIKEAINNIAKYSGALNAEISLTWKGTVILLDIKDDGKGFDTTLQQKGNGLQHMRQRTENLGGTILINAFAGKGTTISCKIPITTISDS